MTTETSDTPPADCYSSADRKLMVWGQEARRKMLAPLMRLMVRCHITADILTAYLAERRDEGAAEASIKYELAMLKKAFNLAIRAEKLDRKPAIGVTGTCRRGGWRNRERRPWPGCAPGLFGRSVRPGGDARRSQASQERHRRERGRMPFCLRGSRAEGEKRWEAATLGD